MNTSTDRIERKILLKASLARVWQALSTPREFGDWFGVAFESTAFIPGQCARGRITYPGYEHLIFEAWVERVEPQRLLSFRWHPNAVDSNDYSGEPTTLVEFSLQPVEDGTLLTLVESGFDQVPPERRLTAFRSNSEGWDEQMKNIEKYVASP